MKFDKRSYDTKAAGPEEAAKEVTAPSVDPLLFVTTAMAHGMLLNKQTSSTIPRQSLDMANAILSEIRRFYDQGADRQQ